MTQPIMFIIESILHVVVDRINLQNSRYNLSYKIRNKFDF